MIVVAGEALVDLIERKAAEATLRETTAAPVYDAHLGGGPYNVARALGRLKTGVGYIFPLSSDRYGQLLAAELRAAGVDLLLPDFTSALTPLALVGLDEAGKASYRFYRQGTADRDFTLEQLIAHLPENPAAVVTGTLAIAEGRDPETLHSLLVEARRRGALTVVDPNMRPENYQDLASYAMSVLSVLRGADVVKASDDDLAILFPGAVPEEALTQLVRQYDVKLAIMTKGSQGALGVTRQLRADVPAYLPATFGDTVGAGDCFLAGFLDALVQWTRTAGESVSQIDDEALSQALRQGVTVAGLNCAHKGCQPPSRDEVDHLLNVTEA